MENLKNFKNQDKTNEYYKSNYEDKKKYFKLVNEVQIFPQTNKNDLSKLDSNKTINLKFTSNQKNSTDFSKNKNNLTIDNNNNYSYSNFIKNNKDLEIKFNNSLTSSRQESFNIDKSIALLNNTLSNENITYKDPQIEDEFNDELKKKLECQKNVIEEYENWLVLLLNILSKTKYNDYIQSIELVIIFIIKTLDKIYNLYENNMELKKGFFKELKKGDDINKKIDFLKSLLIEKIQILSSTENGALILKKRELIESLDYMCKEVT